MRPLTILGVCVLVVCGSSGCADFWDKVTAQDFKLKTLWEKEPSPLIILRDSSDGAKKGLALAALKEPKQHGGTDQQQDDYIHLLEEAATKSMEPLCRLGAIQALADYKDPRAAQILDVAYKTNSFADAQLNTDIRNQALNALEKTGSPIARNLFMIVAASPGPDPKSILEDRDQTDRERLAALRGLARFHDPVVAGVLLKVLADEKNVALKDRAQMSLVAITGKTLPPDAAAWRAYLEGHPPTATAAEPNIFQKIVNPMGN